MSRAHCARCQRPLAACICACARPVAAHTSVLILQDPTEQHQAKGTARLLQLCLAHCEVRVGECFAPPSDLAQRPYVLLYPPSPEWPAASWTGSPAATPPCLIALDGTWRKSRKLLYANPWLQALPRLALQDLPASQYHIRRAHAPHQLSTFEAVACALRQLERQSWPELDLAMHDFVQMQAGFRQTISPQFC